MGLLMMMFRGSKTSGHQKHLGSRVMAVESRESPTEPVEGGRVTCLSSFCRTRDTLPILRAVEASRFTRGSHAESGHEGSLETRHARSIGLLYLNDPLIDLKACSNVLVCHHHDALPSHASPFVFHGHIGPWWRDHQPLVGSS